MNWRLSILLSAIVGCGLATAWVYAAQCEQDCRHYTKYFSCRKHVGGACHYFVDYDGSLNNEWVAYDTNSGAAGSVNTSRRYYVDASYCGYSCTKTGQDCEGYWKGEPPTEEDGTYDGSDNLSAECRLNS
jgi:hypothetical protein